jgi:membrane-bound lytic murein transglycosylase B
VRSRPPPATTAETSAPASSTPRRACAPATHPPRLAAELETHAADAQRDRFADLLRRSGLTEDQYDAVVESTAFGPLTAALRRAEAYHHDLEQVVPRIVAQHELDDADDVAAVLRHRLDKAASQAPQGKRGLRPRLIAGLIPNRLGR